MFQQGDPVEFKWYENVWLPGRIYAIYADESVAIMADQPSQLFERPIEEVRRRRNESIQPARGQDTVQRY